MCYPALFFYQFFESFIMSVSRNQLFPAIEQALKASSEPLDCAQLFAMPEIRKHANTVSRVSDYLGNLWRRNAVLRLPARDLDKSRSRWCYQWRHGHESVANTVEYIPQVIADRPSLLITELGNVVTIEMPSLVISIRNKPQTFAYLEGLKGG